MKSKKQIIEGIELIVNDAINELKSVCYEYAEDAFKHDDLDEIKKQHYAIYRLNQIETLVYNELLKLKGSGD